MSDTNTTAGVAIEAAYVSAESGIATPREGGTAAPDQIYVELSRAVTVGGEAGPAPADGFTVDGTFAGLETVEVGETEGGNDGPGSRVLVLTLSNPIRPNERPTLSYTPRTGIVRTPDGTEVESVDGVEVTVASPRVEHVALSEGRDAVRLAFDRPVRSRTGDASTFSLTGDATLTGDLQVDGSTVVLPLEEALPAESGAEPPTLEYRVGGGDAERVRNLVGTGSVPVGSFELTVRRRPPRPRPERAWVPEGGPRDQVLVLFDRPVTVEDGAGLTLEEAVARVDTATDCDDLDEAAPRAITLKLNVPFGEPPARVRYDAEAGSIVDETGRPVEPFIQPVDALPPAPVAETVTAPQNESELRVHYDREVRLSMNDATGFALSYDGDTDNPPSLTGDAHAEGTAVVLETTAPVDPGLNPKVVYQAGDGTRNVVGTREGVTAASTTARVDRDTDAAVATPADDEPQLLRAEIPRDRRDRIVCTFDAALSTDANAFALSGADASVVSVVESAPAEVTLELDASLAEGATPVVTFDDDA